MKNCGDVVMLACKPLSVWLSVSLFIVAIAAIPFAYRLLGRPASPPYTMAEITELLSQDEPSLYVVPTNENDPEWGIYICTQPQPREQLMRLLRNPKVIGPPRLGGWQGVVLCDRVGDMVKIDEREIQTWGEYGMRIGRLLFFGDPDLLQHIHKSILSHTRG